MNGPMEPSSTNRDRQYPKISPAPNWTRVFTQNDELECPGYVEAFLEAHDTANHYGWAVMTVRGIAVVKVTDWERAKRTMPYQWLNRHPKQPVSVEDTLELAKETAKEHFKTNREEVL